MEEKFSLNLMMKRLPSTLREFALILTGIFFGFGLWIIFREMDIPLLCCCHILYLVVH